MTMFYICFYVVEFLLSEEISVAELKAC